MKPSKHVLATERGSGLVIAIMILVVMAALAAGLISAMSTDRRSSSYDFARGTALDYAEAGVAEALDRIRAGDVPDNRNPRMVAQIFRVSAGSVPAVGADTVGMPTAQPTGQFLALQLRQQGPRCSDGPVHDQCRADRHLLLRRHQGPAHPGQRAERRSTRSARSAGPASRAARSTSS